MPTKHNSNSSHSEIDDKCTGAIIFPPTLDDQAFAALVANIEEWFKNRRCTVIQSAAMTVVQLDGDQVVLIKEGEHDTEQ